LPYARTAHSILFPGQGSSVAGTSGPDEVLARLAERNARDASVMGLEEFGVNA